MKYVTVLSDDLKFPAIIRAIDIEYGKRFNDYLFDTVEHFGMYRKIMATNIYNNLLIDWDIKYNLKTQVIQISDQQLSFLLLKFGTY